MSDGDIRLQFARDDGGALRLVLRQHQQLDYLSIERVDGAGTIKSAVAIKHEEIARFLAGVTECRNVAIGHPKHTGGGEESEFGKWERSRKAAK